MVLSLFFNFFLLQFYFCSSWLWLDDGNRTVESKREFEIWPGLRLRLIDWLYFDVGANEKCVAGSGNGGGAGVGSVLISSKE